MRHFIMEKLGLHQMASGHLCLNLSELVGWDQFPEFADKLIIILDVKVSDKAEGAEMRIWNLQFSTCQIKLVYEDFPQMVSLESECSQGNDILKALAQQLKDKTVTWTQ